MYYIFEKNHKTGFDKGQIVKAAQSFGNEMKGFVKESTEKAYTEYVKGMDAAKEKTAAAEAKKLEADAKEAAKEAEAIRKEAEAEYKAELAAESKAIAEANKEADAEAKKAAKTAADAAAKDAEIAEANRKQALKDAYKADLRSGRATLSTK